MIMESGLGNGSAISSPELHTPPLGRLLLIRMYAGTAAVEPLSPCAILRGLWNPRKRIRREG